MHHMPICVTDVSQVLDRYAFYQRPRFLCLRPSVVFILQENPLLIVQCVHWAIVQSF